MAIRIENVFYLLCYAHGRVSDLSLAPAGVDLGERMENLFAHVLTTTVRRLLRRGIARRYEEKHADLRGVRGKILLGETLARSLLRRGELACRFEELSVELPENRILRAACARLSRHPEVSAHYRSPLAELVRRLGDGAVEPLGPGAFASLPRDFLRADYALPLAIARMLAEEQLPTTTGDSSAFTPFLADAQKMGALFEEFVTGFLRLEVPEARLLGRSDRWKAEGPPHALELLPRLVRDVPYALDGRKVLVECKFYESPLVASFGGTPKLRAAHLNQLHAYLTNETPETRGVLLYAAPEAPFETSFTLGTHPVDVRCLNLNQPWREVHRDLRAILVGAARH